MGPLRPARDRESCPVNALAGVAWTPPLGRRLDLELVGQLANLCRRVATVVTESLQNGSLPSLAQRDTVLSDTCKMAATAAARR